MRGLPNVMYVGPTIVALGLKQNTIYRGLEAMPPQLVNLVNVKPMLASLFVPTVKIAEAKKNIMTNGTIENLAFSEVIKMMKGQR